MWLSWQPSSPWFTLTAMTSETTGAITRRWPTRAMIQQANYFTVNRQPFQARSPGANAKTV